MLYDDYLPCSVYVNQPLSADYHNVTTFFDEESSRFFFALIDREGKVLLKSEGYPQENACQTGLKSVLKNYSIEKQYSVKKEGDIFYLSLKAGNNREIARSCDFESDAQALENLTYIAQYNLSFEEKSDGVFINEEDDNIAVQATEPIAGISKMTTTVTIEETSVESLAESTENLEISIEPIISQPEVMVLHTETEYLDDDNYFSHNRLWNEYGETGYAKFSHKNGKSYFVVYNPDQSIYLRSKGFDSSEVRDAELQLLANIITQEESFEIIVEENGYFVILKDNSGKEIAKSVKYDTFTAALITTPRGRTKEITDSIF
jgi:uncharacterized protein YegP (UPF0339 family)